MIESSERLNRSHQETEPARTRIEDSKRIAFKFVNTELDLCRTFAESALASVSAGRVDRAEGSAWTAREAYKTAQKFLRITEGEQMRLLEAKLADVEVLLGKLSGIK